MPFWLLIPGAILVWTIAQRFAEGRDKSRMGFEPIHPVYPNGHQGPKRKPFFRPEPKRLEAHGREQHAFMNVGPRLTAADYLQHLNAACAAARVLDTVKPYALKADITSLMQSPPEVAHALVILSQPIPVMFAQRDLNVLGASPPLPESGVLGPETVEAIRSIQSKFGQAVTGQLDDATSAAIRYAVGCIYSQDKAEVL